MQIEHGSSTHEEIRRYSLLENLIVKIGDTGLEAYLDRVRRTCFLAFPEAKTEIFTKDQVDEARENSFDADHWVQVPLGGIHPTALLQISAASPFSNTDLNFVEKIAKHASIAIENLNCFYQTLEALAEAIEKKDLVTGSHVKRVVLYSTAIAREMGFSEESIEQLKLAAVLHDVGKIGIEDSILKKAAPLTEEEWTIMETHSEIGYEILQKVPSLIEPSHALRHHHERWDGGGYPAGLKKTEIPLHARVIAVADSYDAIVSDRPYRKGLTPEEGFREIVANSGTQFDPAVVTAFEAAFKKPGWN